MFFALFGCLFKVFFVYLLHMICFLQRGLDLLLGLNTYAINSRLTLVFLCSAVSMHASHSLIMF